MKTFLSFLSLVFASCTLSAQQLDPSFSPEFYEIGIGTDIKGMSDGRMLVKLWPDHLFLGREKQMLYRLLPDGNVDSTFQVDDRLQGEIDDFLPQEDGKVILLGNFYSEEGEALDNLLRLSPQGRLDSTFLSFSDSTYLGRLDPGTLALLSNQKFLLSLPVRGETTKILLLEQNGQIDTHFSPLQLRTDAFRSQLHKMLIPSDNEILLAGQNLVLNGLTQNVIKVDSLGRIDSSYNPILPRSAMSVYRNELETINIWDYELMPNGDLVLMGITDQTQGYALALFDQQGDTLTGKSLVIPAGAFGKVIPSSQRGFIVLGDESFECLADGSINYLPGLDIQYSVYDVARFSDQSMVIVGGIVEIGGHFSPGIARIAFSSQTNVLEVDTSFTGRIFAQDLEAEIQDILVQEGGKIVVVGEFENVNGQRQLQVSRLQPAGEIDHSFNPAVGFRSRPVLQIREQSNGNLVVSGAVYGNEIEEGINGLILMDSDGFQVNRVLVENLDLGDQLPYLEVDSRDYIYTGSPFSRVDFELVNNDWRTLFSQTLNVYDSLGNFIRNYEEALINSRGKFTGILPQWDDKLLIFGHQLSYENSPLTYLVRALPSGRIDSSFQLIATEQFIARTAIISESRDIYVAGTNRDPELGSIAFLYKLDSLGNRDFGFTPTFGNSQDTLVSVSRLFELPNNQLLVYGSFDSYRGKPVSPNRVVIDRQTGAFLSDFLPQVDSLHINALALKGRDTLYVAGFFRFGQEERKLIRVGGIDTLLTHQIKDLSARKNEFTLYPNPASGNLLTFKWEEIPNTSPLSYEVFSLYNGQIVMKGELTPLPISRLDISQLRAGIYVFKLKGTRKGFRLFVKQ